MRQPTTTEGFLKWLKLWGVTAAAITFDSDKGALLEIRGFRRELSDPGDYSPKIEFAMLISNEDIRQAGL